MRFSSRALVFGRRGGPIRGACDLSFPAGGRGLELAALDDRSLALASATGEAR